MKLLTSEVLIPMQELKWDNTTQPMTLVMKSQKADENEPPIRPKCDIAYMWYVQVLDSHQNPVSSDEQVKLVLEGFAFQDKVGHTRSVSSWISFQHNVHASL